MLKLHYIIGWVLFSLAMNAFAASSLDNPTCTPRGYFCVSVNPKIPSSTVANTSYSADVGVNVILAIQVSPFFHTLLPRHDKLCEEGLNEGGVPLLNITLISLRGRSPLGKLLVIL